MRAFCTVSAPLEVCASSADQLSPGTRFLALRLLGNQQPKTLYFLVDAKSRVREVYTQTCLHFAAQGMLDTELFGLAVLIDGEYMFADPESKLSKYGPKSWRSSHTHGLDANGRPLLELHFRVQFYIESPFILRDEISRHNYYLQLKHNALQRELPKEYSEQSMILLAGLALQADLGDAPAAAHAQTQSINTAATTTSTPPKGTTLKSLLSGESSCGAGGLTECDLPRLLSSHVTNCPTANTNDVSNLPAKTKEATAAINTEVTPPTAAMKPTDSTTTTLPKITKRLGSESDRVLRLSNFLITRNSTSSAATTPALIEKAKSITTSDKEAETEKTKSTTAPFSQSTSIFPISGSLKRSIGAVAASFSASSSLSSMNRNSSSNSPPTTATSSSTSLSVLAQTQSSAMDYFNWNEYLPMELRNSWALNALKACHREYNGMSTADAELHYIQHACMVHDSVNAHIYRMRSLKTESGLGSTWFVVYSKGIKIFSSIETPQQQTTFLWPSITKLSFERKKFEIRSGDCKILLYATSDEKNKMLLTLCRETHQFSMKIAARLKEVIKREEEESNCLHASYIYSRSLHLPYKNKSDQRISVISSTSSNTTSGIVSDRVHSEDEVEIMINTPPAPIAAPSTESLALAHLLDHPSVSRQTSSVGQVSLKDLEEHLAALSVRKKQHTSSVNSGDESSVERCHNSAGNSSSSSSNQASQRAADSSTATDSPSSQHNIGSQCSSTCSTVVVLPSSNSTANTLTSLHSIINSTPMQRRNSTSSSLELGFSHTAQNSILSEAESTCIDHDFASSRDENESVSGVYTLAHGAPPTETSGVYTMHSSEMTGESSEIAESEKSSHYGIFQPSKGETDVNSLHESHSNLDSVDGGSYQGKRIKNEEFRLRSDSNVSTSGSFRGDGSDPTDNKHNLLSAEELTDLIVGRGTYPNRKTVSSTLDSDCDYVTLPLPIKGESYIQGHQDTAPTDDQVEDLINDLIPTDPPAPPQRIDSNSMKHATNLVSLSNIPMRSPPPYHARHEKTGLCGPPVCPPLAQKPTTNTTSLKNPTTFSQVPSPTIQTEVKTQCTVGAAVPRALLPTAPVVVRRHDPPPYPTSAKPRPTSLVSVASSTSSLNHSNGLMSSTAGSLSSLKTEEVTARFITTRPQINILKAHTSVINDNQKPSYAAPTHCSSAASTSGSISSQHMPSHFSQHSVHNSHYISGSQVSLNGNHHSSASATRQSSISAAAVAHAAAAAAVGVGAGVIPSTIGIPIVPYSLHGTHSSMSSLHQQPPPPPPPYPEIKQSTRTCVLLPVIKHRQFLPPPPPNLPRQPPPPPPPSQLAGVYGNQLARKQLELYQQQLYSDVDYVIYPIQDPAVSQQEYLDAKQSSIYAAMAQSPPQPLSHPHPYLAYHAGRAHVGSWDTCKGHAIYRSTPYLPLALSTHSRYASTQNLSDTYVQLPSTYSPLYSPSMASLCSSYEPPPPPPLHPSTLTVPNPNNTNLFARSRSDDNILNSIDSLPKVKRMPPPPPPPYVNRRLKKPPMPAPTEKPPPIPSKPNPTHVMSTKNQISMHHQLPPRKPPTLNTNRSVNNMTRTSSGAQWAGERPKPNPISYNGGSILAHLQASAAAANRQAASTANTHKSKDNTSIVASANTSAGPGSNTATNPLDIAVLREKSKHMDLPLISALCNDQSLLKQTKVFASSKTNRLVMATTLRNACGLSTSPNGHRVTTLSTNHSNGNKTIHQSLSSNAGALITAEASTAPPLSPSVQVSATTSATTTMPSTSTTTHPTAITTTKYATSATPTLQLASAKGRKVAGSHRHPNDKLPPLPMQMAEANNYVMDPAITKHHKSYNSQM
ncbi:protein expanded [Ceratitis capitata]|uniref:protein expanded n=1 Tax=Ceratitis capitata TaxID=7213 RepID=UPI000329D980|nr:protein expanded [Ceratitis capitata]XP_004530314.1 protein expanded [Ceratitis capitata]XP_004530315.1 protein expanded [Ceratitis capitata]